MSDEENFDKEVVDEDVDLALELKKAIQKTVKEVLEKNGTSEDYYQVVATLFCLNNSFRKFREIPLLEEDHSFCDFCGQPSKWYESDMDAHLCPSCYAKLKLNVE